MTSMKNQHFEADYVNEPSWWIPHFALDSKTLLRRVEGRIEIQTAAFCARQAAFCFGPLCSAFGVRRPRLPLNHHSFQTKAILHCELAFQKDVVDPSLKRCVHLPTMGQSPF